MKSVKEFIRKRVVYLKRNPSIIPLLVMLSAFLVYSLNLTKFSNTTAKLLGSGMGLSQFVTMLFSLLCMVCMLNAFPRRKKPNILMIVVMFLMFAAMLYCDTNYSNGILAGLQKNPSLKPYGEQIYISQAYNVLNIHRILIVVSAVLVILLPVYSKLLRKIKTSIDVEDNGDMAEIEINE